MATKLIPQDFEMVSGDDKTVRFTVTDQDGVAQDLTGASATWAFSRRARRAAIATKTVGSGITISDAANGIVDVTVARADTETIEGDFYHELEIVDGGGTKSTAAYGTMTVLGDLIP